MKKSLLFGLLMITVALLVSCASLSAVYKPANKSSKINSINKILYFNPEVYPDVLEIKEPTYLSFFSAATDKMMTLGAGNYLKVDTPISYDEIDVNIIKELCENNDADVAIIPKVTYFKVGLGKYVFSNQVEVGLKLYDASGNFIMETTYDTYKANGRLLGSAENSVKIGTKGALSKLYKELQSKNITFAKSTEI